MDPQPLVSIVTPLYNAERFLRKCIESVLRQTYENWEYLIVDNRSTDRSAEIAQAYAHREPRIRLHTNAQFLSPIQNHNHAFRLLSAEARYCKVVHADDWLFPNCLSEMVALAEAHPCVGIVGSYRLINRRVRSDGLPYPSTVVPGREMARASLLGGPYVFGSPTSLLIRADLIRRYGAFYNEANLHADTEACYELLRSCDFGFVHQVLTFTRRHPEAETSFARRYNTYALSQLLILKKYGPEFLSAAEFERRWRQVLDHYDRFLGRSLFELRERRFWAYHRDAADKLGIDVRWPRVFRGALFEVVDALRLPWRTLAKSRRSRDGARGGAIRANG